MILQALTDYYRVLEQAGKIDAPGWAPVKVSYALLLSENGTLEQVIDIQTEQPRGKKMVSAPQILSLPAPVKRTVGVAANFLCDNAGYLLGIDSKGKPQRTRECFEASRSLHEQLLAGVDSPAVRAVAAFFRSWDPGTPRSGGASGGYSLRRQPDLPHPGRLCPQGSLRPEGLGRVLSGRGGWSSGDLLGHRAAGAGGKRPPRHQKRGGRPVQRSGPGVLQRPGLLLLRKGAEPQRSHRQVCGICIYLRIERAPGRPGTRLSRGRCYRRLLGQKRRAGISGRLSDVFLRFL